MYELHRVVDIPTERYLYIYCENRLTALFIGAHLLSVPQSDLMLMYPVIGMAPEPIVTERSYICSKGYREIPLSKLHLHERIAYKTRQEKIALLL